MNRFLHKFQDWKRCALRLHLRFQPDEHAKEDILLLFPVVFCLIIVQSLHVCLAYVLIFSRYEEMADEVEEANCPVCLLPLRTSDVGTPECCDHDFCLRCILEWSKVIVVNVHHTFVRRFNFKTLPFSTMRSLYECHTQFKPSPNPNIV